MPELAILRRASDGLAGVSTLEGVHRHKGRGNAATRTPGGDRVAHQRQQYWRCGRTRPQQGADDPLGERVDKRLAEGDVRLTVGGEPTFVSIDNQVDPEWTTDADGPDKRVRASVLAARCKKIWAPRGLVQRSQGKWYPGEPLPRWQIGLLWRTDGQPLWRDPSLLADPWPEHPQPRAVDPDVPRAVLAGIAESLGLPPTQVRPAHEDPLSRLGAAVRLPAGDPVSDRASRTTPVRTRRRGHRTRPRRPSTCRDGG